MRAGLEMRNLPLTPSSVTSSLVGAAHLGQQILFMASTCETYPLPHPPRRTLRRTVQ